MGLRTALFLYGSEQKNAEKLRKGCFLRYGVSCANKSHRNTAQAYSM